MLSGKATGETLELSGEPVTEPVEKVKPKTRVGLSKRKPPRKALSQIDYMQTLRGFNMYTGEGL